MNIVIVIVVLICILVIAYYFLRDTNHFNGGSYATSRIVDPEDIPMYDNAIIDVQLNDINNYEKQIDRFFKYLITSDIHDSVDNFFIPLIEAGIIEQPIMMQHHDFLVKVDAESSTNKVIYCGDILGYGANKYALGMLSLAIDLATNYPDRVILVLGEHEINFMLTGEPSECDHWAEDADEIAAIRQKLENYFKSTPNSIAYIWDMGEKSFIASHTFLNKSILEKRKTSILSNEMLDWFRRATVAVKERLNGMGVEFDATENEFVEFAREHQDLLDNHNILYRQFVISKIGDSTDRVVSSVLMFDVTFPRRAQSNDKDDTYFGECIDEDGHVDVQSVHQCLCRYLEEKHDDLKNIFDIIFNNGKLKGITEIFIPNDDGLYRYKTTYDDVKWFIGHTPVQSFREERRRFEYHGVKFQCLDVNSNSFTGDGYKSVRDRIPEKYKYTFETIYYATLDIYGEGINYEYFDLHEDLVPIFEHMIEYGTENTIRRRFMNEMEEREPIFEVDEGRPPPGPPRFPGHRPGPNAINQAEQRRLRPDM